MRTVKARFLVVMSVTVALVALGPGGVAGASPPTFSGSGLIIEVPVGTPTIVPTGNAGHVTLTNFLTFTGTITGSATCTGEGVAVLSGPNAGHIEFRAECPFTGMVDSASGSACIDFHGTGNFITDAFEGTFSIRDGTGGLADVHGAHGTFDNPPGPFLPSTYEVQGIFIP